MAKTVADLPIERLSGWGVKTIFSLPGDGINGIYEALRTHKDQIQVIQVRHEEAAAFVACGHAKYTGSLGVCMATSGPGGIHLLNGLYDAKMDGQPVLAITGHTFHDLIGTHYQQDVDLVKLFLDVAYYNERVMGGSPQYGVQLQPIDFAAYARAGGAGGFTVDDPDKIGDVLGRAFAHPRPALVEAIIDPNEPPMPGHVTLEQAWHFAEAILRGTRDGSGIVKTVLENKIREVV